MNAFYIRFEANEAFYAGLQNAIVRFWEAKLQETWGDSTDKGEGTSILGSGFFPKTCGRHAIFPNIFSVGDF